MRKVGISVLLFLSAVAYGQTINPNQIRPSGTNGYVLTTTAGATVWAPAGTGGVLFQTNSVNNISQSVLNLEQGANVTITNPTGGNVIISASNGMTLPPPFPVPNGQAVAWAYPTASTCGPTVASTNGFAACGPQAGIVAKYFSSPLGNCCWAATWNGFVMPTLPSDAVIQGVYGVEFVQHLFDQGTATGITQASCNGGTMQVLNNPADGINYTGEYYTVTSLGSTASNVTSASCNLNIDSSLGPATLFNVNYINQVAIAIYYTTATPPPLLPYAPVVSNIQLQVNGTANGNQGLLNLAQGSNITLTDNGTGTVTIAAAAGVTWPASTDLVVSNSTNTPAGLAVVNGDCVVGSGGAWVAGSCAGTSSGTNVSVNGGSSLSAANFNATTPAAPTNGINATWQISGSTVSAAIVGDGNAAHFLNGTGGWTTPSGGGGGGGGLVPIAQTVVSGTSTTSVTFSSIAGTFNDLQVVFSGQSSSGSADVLLMRFNGDSAADYDYSGVFPLTSSASGYSFTGATAVNLGGFVPPSSGSFLGSTFIDIPSYANTSFFKPVTGLTVGGSTNGGTWHSTSAINSITFTLSSGGHFIAGSTVTLYGTSSSGGGSSAFSAITSGTNTTAAMLVGTGASLAPTGSGTITANAVNLAASGNGGVTGLLPHANIAATAVTPGSYTNANITVAADGSITAAANGSSGGSVAFSGVTAGTNTNALLVGTGGSFGPTGSGTITATTMPVGGLTGTTLPSSIVTSSLTTVGTIATGTWAGTTIAASHGGTGIANTATLTLGTSNQNWATLGTGIVKNTTTTGAITDATSADVIGLWTGTCSSSTFLRGDGVCAAASGSSGISGLTTGFLPIAGSSTTLTANSHIDDGVTTAATLTASEPLAVTGAPGIIMAHATATPGVVGSVVYTVDATTGFAEVNENNTGLSRICTAGNGICPGSGFPIILGSTSIAASSTTTTLTGFASIGSAVFAGTGSTQTVVNLVQGTAAASPPANAIQFGAPTTVTTSYNAFLPTLAPTDAAGDVWVVPNGGGTGTWHSFGCGSNNIPCTNTANTFTANQSITSAATSGNILALHNSSTSNLSIIDMQSAGGHDWQLNAGGTLFGPSFFYLYDVTTSGIAAAWTGTGVQIGAIQTLGFTSGVATGTVDTALTRAAAGVFALGTGAVGNTGGSLELKAVIPQVYTVATLPAASSFPAGGTVVVSDASTFTPGTCTGGGSDYMIAVTNATTWSCH